MEPTPPVKRGFSLFRRDFLTGAVAGFTGSIAAGYFAPMEWKQKAFPLGTKLTFSQSGEDLIVAGLFKEFKIEKPTYLDVGDDNPMGPGPGDLLAATMMPVQAVANDTTHVPLTLVDTM